MKVACTQQDSVKCKAVGYCYAKYINYLVLFVRFGSDFLKI